jgi:hypothetical protein
MGARASHASNSSNPERELIDQSVTDRQDVRATVTLAPDVNIHRDAFQVVTERMGLSLQFVYSAKSDSILQVATSRNEHIDSRNCTWTHETLLSAALAVTQRVQIQPTDVSCLLAISPVSMQSQRQLTYVKFTGTRAKLTLQKLEIGDKVLIIHDIYGAKTRGAHEDESLECVVCMTALRCSIVLPCRHLCLCAGCSDVMRSQGQPKCPMCRTELDAVVQVAMDRPARGN